MNTLYWNKANLYRHVDSLKSKMCGPVNTFPIYSKQIAVQNIKNLVIEEVPFWSTNICGILYKGNDSTSIALNQNRTTEMQNFDCMHELIHYFFHDVEYGQKICSDRDGCYIGQDSHIEWQANEGAAQFLVPYQDFLVQFSYMFLFDRKNLQSRLAQYYGVTQTMIDIRIDSLSYEIDQYLNGIPLEDIQLLSKSQQNARGITATSYRAALDFDLDWDDIVSSGMKPKYTSGYSQQPAI